MNKISASPLCHNYSSTIHNHITGRNFDYTYMYTHTPWRMNDRIGDGSLKEMTHSTR